MLDEVAQNAMADAQTVAQALEEKTALAVAMEREAAVETLLAARGFGEALCTVHEGSVNVVVNTPALSEEDAIAIMELVARETGADASDVRVIAEN